jgi:phospholipid/cholesterol/gamma-HCH transport system permease protein
MGELMRPVAILGDGARLALRNVLCLVRLRFSFRKMMDELARLGVGSVTIIVVTAFFVGMVLAMEVSVEMERFGLQIYVANVVTVSLVRELSPIFTALLIAGFGGSGITAEIGGMTLSNQVEAMRMLSLDVNRHFIAPICLAATVAGVCLTVVFDLVGVTGGYVVGTTQLGIPLATYHEATKAVLEMPDVACGLIKGAVFGALVGIIGCHAGLRVQGGVLGLAEATRRSVVTSMVVVLVSDYFLTRGIMFFIG